MSVMSEVKRALASAASDYWRGRLEAEIDFLDRALDESNEAAAATNSVRRLFRDGLEEVAARAQSDGAVTRASVRLFEEALREASPLCKAYELVCVGHAHIDMNWMWGFHETVMVTIDTMRTVLDLLGRYPQFRFSQSQASVYRIVERYAPELVEPIRKRIAEGRWEVTAGQWVETDMNLPSGESLARQMLYARRYLIDCYTAPEEAFRLVFLPDTFGHNANAPEVFAAAGVRYLYHCRGSAGPHLSRWEAPSGRSVLAYREPRWYNTDVTPEVAGFLPRFAKESGLKKALCVYGVGDHGGGPTVRDIEQLTDMGSWPLFPKVSFGTLNGYFDAAAASGVELPTARGERNMIFTGCYTSQSRIKMANRAAERLLYEAELEVALARIWCGSATSDAVVAGNLTEAWTKALFSHFHDILPGSGVQLTREYALGSFQETAAAALAAQSGALLRLAALLAGGRPASAGKEDAADRAAADSRSEGAGVGFGAERFALPAAERGAGRARRYLVFNPLQWARTDVAEITVWDWPDSAGLIECLDDSGELLGHQIVSSGKDTYWGHTFVRLKVEVRVPAFGFAGVLVRESPQSRATSPFFPYGVDQWLVERPARTVLENEKLRAIFDPVSMRLVALEDKATRETLCEGGFRVVEEEAERMTAWIVGRYQSISPVESAARIVEAELDSSLPEQWIRYESPLPHGAGNVDGNRRASWLSVRVSLPRGEARLRYEVDCRWLELGSEKGRVPQLQYALRLSGDADKLRCDIPFGTIDREAQDLDVPANSFAAVLPRSSSRPLLQVTLDSRHAFRLCEKVLSATLIRSSVDPDPYPEVGHHQLSFVVSVLPAAARATPSASIREAAEVCNRVRAVSLAGHRPGGSGELAGPGRSNEPSGGPLLSVGGAGCIVAAVKTPEPATWGGGSDEGSTAGQRGLVVRVYDADGRGGDATLALPGGPRITSARLMDLHEREVTESAGRSAAVLSNGAVRISSAPYEVVTVMIHTEG